MNREALLSYVRAGYSADQIYEIKEGIQAGLDVTIYARKEFMAIQMRQIRFGLFANLQVQYYASPVYDWFQMEEIRLGLVEGLDVTYYASPEIPYIKMRQLRLGLQEHIDLRPYLDRDAGIIKEIRLARKTGVDIREYLAAGYDAEQLEQLRLALEQGVDMSAYVTPLYRGISLREIRLGLQQELDVSGYAREEYNWRQMRELRLGLEHRVDIKFYQSSYYSALQMQQIRMGLEAGLDVSGYATLMYTTKEMEKRRKKLLAEMISGMQLGETGGEKVVHATKEDTGFQLLLEEGDMKAYIQLVGRKIPQLEEMREVLKEHGVTRGILEEALQDIAIGNHFQEKVLVAEGEPPENGKDGWYEFYFELNKNRKPKMLEDGSVDYMNTDWFSVVEKGQKVAYYHDAKPGSNGYTVTGKILYGFTGRQKCILKGEGFRVLEDGKTYVAAVTGKVDTFGFWLQISQLAVVEEVTHATGNLIFEGSVQVKGNVGSGVRIKAAGDVIVDGYVEAANIECGGNIILRRGVNGAGTGILRAGGYVHGNFFEAVEVHAGKDIRANYCMNGSLYAEGRIVVSGRKGSIVGGITQAARGIETFNAGNRSARPTVFRLGISERLTASLEKNGQDMVETKKQLEMLQHAYQEYQKKYSPEVRNTIEMYRKLEDAIYSKQQHMKRLREDKVEIDTSIQKLRGAQAVIRGRLYEGVTVEIHYKRWVAKEMTGVKIMFADNKIVVTGKPQ